jgi:hypothetical protein
MVRFKKGTRIAVQHCALLAMVPSRKTIPSMIYACALLPPLCRGKKLLYKPNLAAKHYIQQSLCEGLCYRHI